MPPPTRPSPPDVTGEPTPTPTGPSSGTGVGEVDGELSPVSPHAPSVVAPVVRREPSDGTVVGAGAPGPSGHDQEGTGGDRQSKGSGTALAATLSTLGVLALLAAAAGVGWYFRADIASRWGGQQGEAAPLAPAGGEDSEPGAAPAVPEGNV